MIEYVRHDGGFVAYRTHGGGALDLVYLGGQAFSIEAAEHEPHVARWYRRLASVGRVVEFDPPGLGLSDPPVAELTLDSLAACVVTLLDHLGLDRAALIGAGAGGPVALTLAANCPPRVSSLVLINAYARLVEADDYPIGLPLGLVEQLLDQRMSPGLDWSTTSADGFALMNPTLRDDPMFRRWAEEAVRRSASPATLGRLDRLYGLADVREHLRAIAVPTLVLTRHHNVIAPPVFGRYLADNLVDARYSELPGGDYAPFAGDVDALADQIEEFLTGRRDTTGDRVLTTVLFTDIVDSTGRLVALGDREWRSLLDHHDAAVRSVIDRYGGSEVNTTGDGFLARFESPTHAVRAGHEIVTDAARAEIAVRVGIHSGECEIRGNDLAGITVHIAARVAEQAEPGEVLVSRTVRDLVAGSELHFTQRGERQLKGLQDPWHVFALEPTEP